VRVCACVLGKDFKELCYISVPMAISLQGLGWGGSGGIERQENSYTKHALTNRFPVTVTLGRVNELPIFLMMCLVS
jgi:hypothetical protein